MTDSSSAPKVHSRFLKVGSIRTHYLEGGDGPPLVLIHGGEFGGCAEISWEFNIEELARHFRVIAPDLLGFGQTSKIFEFGRWNEARVEHVRDFLDALCINRAHFLGNSMGGTMILEQAAAAEPLWPMDRIVIANGGGNVPDNETRQLLNTYDCSEEHMGRIVNAIFFRPDLRDNEEYIRRRHRLSIVPGAWECTSAPRFRAPGAPRSGYVPPDYSGVTHEVMLIVGALDNLREPGFGPKLQAAIPGSRLHMVDHAGHCPHIDRPDEFNRVAIEFLKG